MKRRLRQYLLHPVIRSEQLRKKMYKKHDLPGLSSITITPTVACNLRCELCYNLYEIHEHKEAFLDYQIMSRVISEAKEMGAFRVSLIGGEPLICQDEIRRLATEHSDVLFTVITNGLLVTPELADSFAALGNIELSFSVDGLEKRHDENRGAGTFRKVLAGMALYRDAGGMLLFSPTVTSENVEEILSDDFLAIMRNHGAYMGYYHHYDLVGGQARYDLLLSPKRLAWMKKRIKHLHLTQDLSIFSNVVSNLLQGGCPAVKEFVHINHKGELEACCMVPFASRSIIDQPLIDALRSTFFKRLDHVKGDEAGIKRCLIGENSQVLHEAVLSGEAFGTNKRSEELFAHHAHVDLDHLPTCFSSEA